MVGAALMFGGVGVVAATGGNGAGDCDQTQDQTRLQLKDGSCNTEGCQNYSWDHNYDWEYDYGST